MRILLDTHIVLWSLLNSPKLPDRARSLISNVNNEIYVSVISLWEVAIKHARIQKIFPFPRRNLPHILKTLVMNSWI